MSDELKPFGWLPGGYINGSCRDCGKSADGAKNCWRCRECALAAHNATLSARLATAEADRDAALALLAEIAPSRLIGESHVPYPEGKTTVLMSWDWLRRYRAISRGGHLPSAGDAGKG